MTTVQFQLGGTLKFVTEDEGYALMTVTHEGFTITARADNMAYKLATGMQVGWIWVKHGLANAAPRL